MTTATPNPQSPAPAIPVPALPPPARRDAAPDQLPPALPPFTSYVPTESTDATDFKCGQSPAISGGISGRRFIVDLGLVDHLAYRKIYAYLSITNASDDYFARLRIEFWRQNTLVGWLPLAGAGGNNTGDFVPSVCVAGGVVTDDSIGLILNDGTAIICQPHHIHTWIDRVTVSVETAVNCTSLYVWLGVISSKQR